MIENLAYADPGAYDLSIENLYIAGSSIIKGILAHWADVFQGGIPPSKYTGDLWGSLGGTPDFGLGRESGGSPVTFPGDGSAPDLSKRTRFARKGRSAAGLSRRGGL